MLATVEEEEETEASRSCYGFTSTSWNPTWLGYAKKILLSPHTNIFPITTLIGIIMDQRRSTTSMLQSSTTNDDSSLEAITSSRTRTATRDGLENMSAAVDEPPSKKLRLESLSGSSSAPGTPVDDVDDLYDTPGQSNTPQPRCEQQQQQHHHQSTVAAAEDGAVGSPPIHESDLPLPISTLPGLGLLGSAGPRNVSGAAASEPILAPSTPVLKGHDVVGEVAEPIEAIDSLICTSVQDRSLISDVLPSIEDATPLDATRVPTSGGDSAEEGQWEVDSSAPASSTLGSSSASADDGDEDDADDYQLLGPEEQARILMQGDGGSDDEGDTGRTGKTGLQPKTKNEVIDERVDRPRIDITSDLKIEELGHVESVVGSLIVVKAKVSGTHRVLESGSVLCTEDRRLVGTVSETLGRVRQPYYAVRFNGPDEIAEMGVMVASKIFYVERYSTYVFTDALKVIKGSDASNINDEEVAEDELEFSDDEAEAAYKRRVKHERQSRRDARQAYASGGPPRSGGAVASSLGGLDDDDRPSTSQAVEIDDGAPYTPLARPSNYQVLLGSSHALEEELASAGSGHGRGYRGARGQAREYGRGRGRGGGRGGRGGRARGRARGGWSDHGRGGFLAGPDAPTDVTSQPMNPSYAPSTVPEHQSSPRSAPLAPPFGPAYEYMPQTVASPVPMAVTPLPAALPVVPAYPAMPYGWYPTALSPGLPLVPAPPASAPVNVPPVINAGMPLPAGAFVNPAFFRRTTTTSPLFSSASDLGLSNSDAAFRAAQEQLDLLKSLQRPSSGSP